MVYLDNHTSTKPCGSALDMLKEEYAGSLESRYQRLYDLVGADAKDTFVFTSSGAEAINQVHWSAFLEIARKEGKCHFITSAIEDAPTVQSLKRLEDLGCFVKIAPVDPQGKIDVAKLAELIGPRTAMISIGWVQGLTGVVQPVEEIAALAKEKGVLLHVDATYALGKVYCSFQDFDYLTFAGDRIHSVIGSGGLFAKAGRPLVPLIVGGGEQTGLRGGPLDLPSFLALSAAASQASLSQDLMSLEVARLRDHFEASLPEAKPLFQDTLRVPNVSVLCFPGVHSEMLLYSLQRKGLAATIGGTYAPHLKRVLAASGIDEQTAISFALSRYTTQAEIDRAVILIRETIHSLKALTEDLVCP